MRKAPVLQALPSFARQVDQALLLAAQRRQDASSNVFDPVSIKPRPDKRGPPANSVVPSSFMHMATNSQRRPDAAHALVQRVAPDGLCVRLLVAVRPWWRMRHDNIRVQGNLVPERCGVIGLVAKGPIALELGEGRPEDLEYGVGSVGASQADSHCLVLEQHD